MALIAISAVVVYFAGARQLAFDSVTWKEVRWQDAELRYRMIEDVILLIESGQISNRSQAEKYLGAPEREGAAMWSYILGPERGSWIKADSEWLSLSFDADGGFAEYRLHPD